MQATQLSQEQLEAVISFAADNGRNWKSELRHSWMTCNYAGRTDGNLLNQVRNQFGPSWLVKFNLKAAKATVQPSQQAAQVDYAIQKRHDGAYDVVATNGETVRCDSLSDARFYVFQKTGKTAFQQNNPELYKNEGAGLNFFGSRSTKVTQPSTHAELASIVAAHNSTPQPITEAKPGQAYKIVQTIPGRGMVATCPTDIYAWAEAAGRSVYTVPNLHLRPELQLAPRIQGFVGPMWGGLNDAGQPVIRYEDYATNDTLSR